MKRFAVYVLPIFLWAGTIFALSAQSKLPTVRVSHFDKLMHAFVYAVLGLLLTRAYRGYGFSAKAALFAGLLTAALYGASDEVHQMFTPGRSPDVRDWIADAVGAAIGAGSFIAIAGRKTDPAAERAS